MTRFTASARASALIIISARFLKGRDRHDANGEFPPLRHRYAVFRPLMLQYQGAVAVAAVPFLFYYYRKRCHYEKLDQEAPKVGGIKKRR